MYGFWRLGLRPAPSGGATWVAKGLETATSMKAKKAVTRPSTGTTHAMMCGPVRRPKATAAAEKPVSTSSQRRSEPELGHYALFLGVYFEGHFVRRESRLATNTPLWSRPSTRTSRPTLNRSGTDPR